MNAISTKLGPTRFTLQLSMAGFRPAFLTSVDLTKAIVAGAFLPNYLTNLGITEHALTTSLIVVLSTKVAAQLHL